jgi:hypothetical protein
MRPFKTEAWRSCAIKAASCVVLSIYNKVSFRPSFDDVAVVHERTLASYNNANFPPLKPVPPGQDPIVGQTGNENRQEFGGMSGASPLNPSQYLSFPLKFVQPLGGEYFFIPSIDTIKRIAA